MNVDDTIAAIATAPGASERGIVRISGPQVLDVVSACFSPEEPIAFAELSAPTLAEGDVRIEELSVPALLMLWPTSKSYTRQPTAEFHTIGSGPVLKLITEKACQCGARLAEPGEFTLRAFLSGRIDLTQAEAVLAVIDSEGEQQLNIALEQLAGGLAGPLGELREDLMIVLAELEAGLDFVEEDIEFISSDEIAAKLEGVNGRLSALVAQIECRGESSEAIKVVLTGLPNSGKSSLFNALTDSDKAIVTDIPGTTTDFVVATIEHNGRVIELVDTAGVESKDERISQSAQVHRETQTRQAQLKILCIDSARPLDKWESEQLVDDAQPELVVLTKQDLKNEYSTVHAKALGSSFLGPIVSTSSKTGQGLDELLDQLSQVLNQTSEQNHAVLRSTVLRASESLADAKSSIARAMLANQDLLGEELVAAEIRQALTELGAVVGTIYTDDILDLVFGKFCIGK